MQSIGSASLANATIQQATAAGSMRAAQAPKSDADGGAGPAATAQFSAVAMRMAGGDADHDGDSQ